jgi:tetratricopeptide (TPR) repeat protein
LSVHRAIAAFCLLAVLGAGSYLAWFWRESSRPGMQRYLRGMELLSARYPKEAEQEWLRGITEDPTEYHCWEQLGDYYTTLRQFEQAVDCYSTACRLAPRNGSLLQRLSTVERKLGRRDRALAAARRAAELLPTDADAVGAYGILLHESRNRPAALQALRRAHRLRPDDRRYFLAMVNAAMDSLDFPAAERDLAPYLRRHPKDADACYAMAVIYNQKPRTPENLQTATDFAERALAGMPHDVRAYTLLGQLYLDADRTEDALRVYTAGRSEAPNAEGVFRGLMECYSRLNRTVELIAVTAEFEKVLARRDRIAHLTHVMGFDHKNTKAGLELARLVEEDGRIPQARAYYEQLVRQSPKEPRTRRALSGFYARLGWKEHARRALRPSFQP